MAAPQPIHVVFVHGFNSSADMWKSFTELIAGDPELSTFVTTSTFEYESKILNVNLVKRIAEIDDIADMLITDYRTKLRESSRIVFVAHSEGGLVVQRFLARMLRNADGRALARIVRIVMFGCPNAGSEFFLKTRKILGIAIRNPQERELRPLVRAVVEAQQLVLNSIVNARTTSETECHIPIVAYGGASDGVVPPETSRWVFQQGGIVAGDHSSMVRPQSRDAQSYQALREELNTAARPLEETGGSTADGLGDQAGPVTVAPPFGSRDTELRGRDRLISLIITDQTTKVHVLAGPGGSGKSRLALEIAYRLQRQGWLVWWVSVIRVNSCMREVANQLGAPESELERAWRGAGSPTDLVWNLLNASKHKWLLVFDNADNAQELGPATGRVSDGTGWLRQPASAGMVLVTTRDSNEATWGRWTAMNAVAPLDDNDGASLLMEIVGTGGGTYVQARELSAQLGGLPLALRGAADYLKSVRSKKVWQGEAAIRDFDSYREAVRYRFESPATVRRRGPEETLGLGHMQEVLALSLDLLAQRGLTQAAPLLKLLACLNITPIPYYVLLTDELLAESPLFENFTASAHEVLEGLTDLGLVEPSVLPGVESDQLSHVLTLHPVVHGIMRGDDDVRDRRPDYYGLDVRLMRSAIASWDPDYPESWDIWYLIAPHAVEVTKAVLLGDSPIADSRLISETLGLARLTLRYLIVAGLLQAAEDLAIPVIEGCASFGFSKDDPEILALRHEKARIFLEAGEPGAAEDELKEVIRGREQSLGAKHHDTLASGHKLAKAILEQGRWAEAEALLHSIVESEQTVRGPEHPDTMVVRHSLARAILAQDRAAEAEVMIRDILQVRNRIWPPATQETLFVRQTLARCLVQQERGNEAEQVVRDAIQDAAAHPATAVALGLRYVLALALLLQEGRTEEVIPELTALVPDMSRALGPTHPDTTRARDLLDRTRKDIPMPLPPGSAKLPAQRSGEQAIAET
jgi:pimeloyl-ACP methyl ester carboxylesterase